MKASILPRSLTESNGFGTLRNSLRLWCLRWDQPASWPGVKRKFDYNQNMLQLRLLRLGVGVFLGGLRGCWKQLL
jgi:hypothetical protein